MQKLGCWGRSAEVRVLLGCSAEVRALAAGAVVQKLGLLLLGRSAEVRVLLGP